MLVSDPFPAPIYCPLPLLLCLQEVGQDREKRPNKRPKPSSNTERTLADADEESEEVKRPKLMDATSSQEAQRDDALKARLATLSRLSMHAELVATVEWYSSILVCNIFPPCTIPKSEMAEYTLYDM
jgi:hypothetical protein